jgi:hypothetical protein
MGKITQAQWEEFVK